MNAFCTIITKSHLPYATTLFQSIQKFGVESRFVVYVVDGGADAPDAGIEVLTPDDLASEPLEAQIRAKYYRQNTDKYRWSMKPVLIGKLLRSGCEKVIFLDSDLYFFEDPTFLFEELDDHNVLLTPHWRCSLPGRDANDFYRNFTHGIFNAGFVGVNRNAVPALEWWANACVFRCEKNKPTGLYDDQRYLDLVPVLFENVKILRHRGCNVANWNIMESPRSIKGSDVVIQSAYPIIFIHFAHHTIEGILNGEDELLLPYLRTYSDHLKQNLHGKDVMTLSKKGVFSWLRSFFK